MTRNRWIAVALALAVAAVGIAALAANSGGPGASGTLTEKQLEQDINNRLKAQTGQAAENVDCPGDLPTSVGASLRCLITVGGQRYGATVTVTENGGENAGYEVQVDQAPAGT